MKTNQKGHQGDVQFASTLLPKGLKKIERKPIAYGEHSGHLHVITGDYEMLEDDKGTLYVSVGNAGAVLRHIHESQFKGYDSKEIMPKADHKPITLIPNTNYIFGIHKRYNPFSKVWEKVID